jgi:hypothetical protein
MVSEVSMVGFILVIGLLITPAPTAYLLSDRLDKMMLLAGLFGMTSVVGRPYLCVWLTMAGLKPIKSCEPVGSGTAYLAQIGTPKNALHPKTHQLEPIREGDAVDYLNEKLGNPVNAPHGRVIS